MKALQPAAIGGMLASAAMFGGIVGASIGTAHRAEAQANAVTGGQITLTDATGRARLAITMTPDNQPSLTLADQNGITRASLSLARDGSAVMQSYDQSGTPVTSVLP